MVDGLQVPLAAPGIQGGLVRLAPRQLTDGNATADPPGLTPAIRIASTPIAAHSKGSVTIRLQTPDARFADRSPMVPTRSSSTLARRVADRWVPDHEID
jgi:hypothetical protein